MTAPLDPRESIEVKDLVLKIRTSDEYRGDYGRSANWREIERSEVIAVLNMCYAEKEIE